MMLLKLISDDNSNNNDIDFTNLSTNNDENSPSKQIKCIFGIVKNNQPKYFFFLNIFIEKFNTQSQMQNKQKYSLPKFLTNGQIYLLLLNSRYSLKSWILEGSNDQISWEKIDEHSNFPGIMESLQTCAFNVQKCINQPYRCIQLRQTAPNCDGDNDLVIGSFELYGTL